MKELPKYSLSFAADMRFQLLLVCFLLFVAEVSAQNIDPYRFVATLEFDNRYQDYWFNKYEQVYPVSFQFNTIQDGNADGKVDTEDACENIIPKAIGENIVGTGRTGVEKRGPNNQRPALYFHYVKSGIYDVYEYWLYYADNDYLNDHEHDWEKYFVYVKEGVPVFAGISHHNHFYLYKWNELILDEGHPVIGVSGGSHAMNNKSRKGVKIRFNGNIEVRKGQLDEGDGATFLWDIYCNDSNVKSAIAYLQHPDCFFNGDPAYYNIPFLSKKGEFDKCSYAPWKRPEWDAPPLPNKE